VGRLLGRHEQTIARLEAVREDEPLHEGLHARLMTALAGNGQQAAALELYEGVSTRLSTELGIEPGPELRAAQLTVLRQEVSPRADAAGHNFLPRDLPDFVGRDTELDRLAAALLTTGGNAVHALSGMPGVGKTALAICLGHSLAAWFPDGQLFVDLRTHSRHAPLTAQAALHTLLRQLGIDGDRIPGRLDESAALWRSLLVGRKMLVVLDDVADAAQVRPLLPGGGVDCRFVITGRSHLTSLEAVGVTPLDVLPDAAASDLLATVAGPHRVAGRDDEVREIAALCGFLPLALRIAAARLRDRPLWTVDHLLSLLRDEHRRLPALSAGDRGVGAALTSSYRRLSPAHQRLYRQLGDFPGMDIVPDTEATARLIEDLVDVNLVRQHALGRYRLHDLVRDHARETARAKPMRRRPTVDRLCSFNPPSTDTCIPPVLFP
jgi:Bacterial transcriptional activator domain/NB-ARC domain